MIATKGQWSLAEPHPVQEWKRSRFRLDFREKFFPVKAVRPWQGLSREGEAAPSLEMFRVTLDRVWNNLVQWKLSLPKAGLE